MKAMISDIQHFSLGDGEGIRTTVFFKGCNLRCRWCHNPETFESALQILKYPTEEKPCGKLMEAAEIARECLEDIDFFNNSKGGVTLSGGEPLLQADAASEVARLLKEQNVHVILDTAGCVPFFQFEKLLPFVDVVFFDIKAADRQKFFEGTKGNFDLIDENLRRLLKKNIAINARIPIIPDFNESDAYFEKIIGYIMACGIKNATLLPFHNLAASKYRALGLEYEFEKVQSVSKARLRELALFASNQGLKIEIENH